MFRALTLAALTLATAACGTLAPLPAARAAGLAEAAAARTAPRLERFTSGAEGFATHTWWVDSGREVVVFDAQFTPQLAEAAIAAIRARTSSPITHLVVTHPNPDKFNGAQAFRAIGAKVVASEATAKAIPAVHAYKKHYFVNVAKMFTEATYPAQARIDVTFRDAYRLPLAGGHAIELRTLKHAGVAATQTVAHIPGAKALVVGDLVHHQAHAWLEGPIVNGAPKPDLASWKAALGELRAYRGTTVYGGRGEPAPVETAVRAQAAYLDGMDRLVRAYVSALPDAKAALAGAEAGKHYKALTARAEQAFPGYGLGFMVEYGVYGLALSVAR